MSISNINYQAARDAVSATVRDCEQMRAVTSDMIAFYAQRQPDLANDAMDRAFTNIKQHEAQLNQALDAMKGPNALGALTQYIDNTEDAERRTTAALGG